MIPGCYDPKARLADMDIDGVHAMLCFPSFPRFCGTVFLEGEDKELALLGVVAEIERMAAKGARAIGLPDNPTNLNLPSYHTLYWDPVFSALEDTNLTAV